MFNKEELNNLQIFLARVQLNGSEAMPLVHLQVRIAETIKALPVEKEVKKEVEKEIQEKK